MPPKFKASGRALSIPAGLALSGTVSIVLTMSLSLFIAKLLQTEQLSWEIAGYWIMTMILLASFIGAKCAYFSIRRQRLAVSIMSGFLYWGILLTITALFFGGNYESVLQTAALIAAGSCSAALIYRHKKGISRKKQRIPYR